MRSILVILLVGIFITGILGCATTSSDKPGLPKDEAMLEPSGLLKFSDIPIPSGFKSLSQDSYSFESAGVRVGLLKYQGKANPGQVVNFFKEQMVMYNWNLLNVIEYGEKILNFDREGESCIITISGKGNNYTITISLGPKSQKISTRRSSWDTRAKDPVK
ncbi:MAG: hypothetical protein ABH882_06205 [Candidatus Omnitrophota bacterium]|nr:hypothetical protein [Candidatus Omnitrophota bacterium]MBU1929071.1 hypothetical protein [Candidatus Omnitrophota bacterium]MBU1929178.1 hypothetical protein [Candidatus Omnitrophota bacterium]MBU2035058.1 hypothetical protein [Candidatus Omnitrophota bacterium]MBU2258257.1 hypothetical protein [Candidatus Omnitrophota bacterium]